MPAPWRPVLPAPSAIPLIGPRAFEALRQEGLVGISDRVLAEHLRHYQKAVAELAELDAARPRSGWRVPADLGLLPGQAWSILNTRVRDLPGEISGRLAMAIAQVFGELAERGIAWRPTVVVGAAEFFTLDQSVTINVPWTLANEVMWRLVNDHHDRFTYEDVVRILRHEVGHALGYAFELWREGYWQQSFGNFFQPYREDYPIDPASRDYVINLHAVSVGGDPHYAQKHPDEDWAETFAIWLAHDIDWRTGYAEWPGALRKLQTVEDLIVGQGRASGNPTNTRPGRMPRSLELDRTVAEYLGIEAIGSLGELATRRSSALRNRVALHELYFDGLARGRGELGALEHFRREASDAFGSFDAWENDMRACVATADGWALCCYDQRERRIRNFVVDGDDRGAPAGAAVLLAIDCWEHAFAGDVGDARYQYAAAVWRNISWPVVETRLQVARAAAIADLGALEPTFIMTPAPALDLPPPNPPAPEPWGVLYSPPNPDGSRKACANCVLFGLDNTCAIHGVPVTADMTCGYHVHGTPSATKIHLPLVPVAPELSGLDRVPGGTSCDLCRFYTRVDDNQGTCSGVTADPEIFKPAPVQALACCARWKPTMLPVAVDPTVPGVG